MQRHRQVAAAPKRRASDTWDAIAELVGATLDRSPHIAASDVAAEMESASAIGRALVAAGHLDKYAIVVVADPIYLNITTVSGSAATDLEEDLGPVPGGATATGWTVFLPTPDPVGDAVRTGVAGLPHFSADEPPGETMTKSASSEEANVLNLDALAQRAQERK
jgi:hypothetical protein